MKAIIVFSIFSLAVLFIGGCELCEQYEQLIAELCQEQPANVKAVNIGDSYQKSNQVWRHRFDCPGSSTNQCDLKFLETKQYLEVDSVELCRWNEHNVGTAFFIVHNKIPFASDSSRYWLKQGRETFLGVYNNDGVCDGGNAPNNEIFYVRFNKCNDWAEVGDTMGLRLVQ